MTLINKRLRVYHFPQVGTCREAFRVEVKDEIQAKLVSDVLANQHLWLYKNNIIGDYSNAIDVEMWDEDHDGEGNAGWCDYCDDDGLDFNEWCDEYLPT